VAIFCFHLEGGCVIITSAKNPYFSFIYLNTGVVAASNRFFFGIFLKLQLCREKKWISNAKELPEVVPGVKLAEI